MSYTICVFIQGKYLSEKGYKNFLQECSKIKGFYVLREGIKFNYSSENEIHECFLIYEDLEEPMFIKLDGEFVETDVVDRSTAYELTLKKNIYHEEFDVVPKEYDLYLEIDGSVSKNPYTMFVHLFIPYVAFCTLQNVIVFDPPLRGLKNVEYFFQKIDYLGHIKQILLACYGQDILSSRDYLHFINGC